MANSDNQLAQIDSKLTALLALFLDGYMRQTGIAKPKERSIDRLLVDAGLSARTVAGLLGKTERAVHLQLQREQAKKKPRRKKAPQTEAKTDGAA
jgi:IS30 family transposase